jgi:uncharacterized membrane protein
VNRRLRGERGSTVPLILGMFLLCILMVAGAIVAGMAFVQQRDLQGLCDGAAAAAASSADLGRQRTGTGASGDMLQLAAVHDAVTAYVGRDPSRAEVHIDAVLAADHASVTVSCALRRPIAFGGLFGFRNGVLHRAVSTARAPVR